MQMSEWQDQVVRLSRRINPNETLGSVSHHIKREAQEVLRARSSVEILEEVVDLLHLGFVLAELEGRDFETVFAVKYAENWQRSWGEQDQDGVVEHVRDWPQTEAQAMVQDIHTT